MRAGDRAVDILAADIGPAEDPPGSNRTKYGAYWGLDGQPYCAMGVAWAYVQAGAPLAIGDGGFWAYVPFGYEYARQRGEFTDSPQRGDVVLYGDAGDQTHTGLFEAWTGPGEFTAIEANTASDDDTDGIYVARRHRGTWWVAGFWHPAAADLEVPGSFAEQRAEIPQREDYDMKVCKTNGGQVVVVEGSTYRVVPAELEWDVVNAAIVEAAAAGVVPPDAPTLPVLGDNALSPSVGLLREVPWC